MIPMLIIGLAVAVVALVAAWVARRWMKTETVYPWDVVLLYRGGAFQRVLESGPHRLFDPFGKVMIARVPATETYLRIGPLDVIAQDRFAFRIHIAAVCRYADARAAYEARIVDTVSGPVGLEDQLAAAALSVVGAQPLEAVIDDTDAVATALSDAVEGTISHVELLSLSIVKIDLPPETRKMLTEAERARREGAAALERARAEQASLRALSNAARLVRDNPELASLRLLKTIEGAKGPTTIVVGDPRNPAAPLT